MGFSLGELLFLEYGDITDLMVESANDHANYNYLATQADFDSAFH